MWDCLYSPGKYRHPHSHCCRRRRRRYKTPLLLLALMESATTLAFAFNWTLLVSVLSVCVGMFMVASVLVRLKIDWVIVVGEFGFGFLLKLMYNFFCGHRQSAVIIFRNCKLFWNETVFHIKFYIQAYWGELYYTRSKVINFYMEMPIANANNSKIFNKTNFNERTYRKQDALKSAFIWLLKKVYGRNKIFLVR